MENNKLMSEYKCCVDGDSIYMEAEWFWFNDKSLKFIKNNNFS